MLDAWCTRYVRRGIALLLVTLVAAPAASAKDRVELSLSTDRPRAGASVWVLVRTDEPTGADCRMQLLAVAPGVSRFEALDALVAGGYSVNGPQGVSFHAIRPTPRMGFVRSMTRVRTKTWLARIRFPTAGRWRLVVPSWCGPGYTYPLPADRPVAVRRH
jgi:hypothetical protein